MSGQEGEAFSELPHGMLAAIQHLVENPLAHSCIELLLMRDAQDTKDCVILTPTRHELIHLLEALKTVAIPEFLLLMPRFNSVAAHELPGFEAIPHTHLVSFEKGDRFGEHVLETAVDAWHFKKHSAQLPETAPPVLANTLQGSILVTEPRRFRDGSTEVNDASPMMLDPQSVGIPSVKSGAFHCTALVAGHSIRALLDTGACLSFISPVKARELQLPVVPGKLKVRSAGGGIIEAHGTVPRQEISVDKHVSHANFWVVQLPTTIDAILGCDWLQDTGVVIDMRKRSISFPSDPQSVPKRVAYAQPAQPETSAARSGEIRPFTNSVNQLRTGSASEEQKLIRAAANQAWLGLGKSKTAKDVPFMGVLDLFGRETTVDLDLGEVGPGLIPHDQLSALLKEFSDVFPADLPPGIPGVRFERFGDIKVIPLIEGAKPVKKRQYRLSPLERAELERQIVYMSQMGWIQKSTSPWGSPVTFAPKEGGGLRLCVDLRGVNQLTIRNRTPLPRIDDLLDNVQGARVFSALDLAAGYHQIPLSPEERERTAFFGTNDLWEYTVLPFGLANAPAVFSSAMGRVFEKYLNKFVLVYLDDILIYSQTPEDHLEHIKLVLLEFRALKMYARGLKCRFNRTSLPYLGHILTVDGIKPDPRKVQLVADWPMPLASVKDVEKFLGLTNYFRKYIRGYGAVTAPISDLRKKGTEFVWSDKCERAAQYLKTSLTSSPILSMPDFAEGAAQFEVICDASGQGIGAGLFQGDSIVSYEGRKYRPAELNYSVGEQELLAVVHALTVWRCYLEGAPKFKVVTDHNPLIWFNTQTMLSRRQSRWSEFMQRFDFEWCYRPGKLNFADPLSRAPSLKAQPVEYLHDGEVLALISGAQVVPVRRNTAGLTTLPDSTLILPATPPVQHEQGEQQSNKGYNTPHAVRAHSLFVLLRCCRGRGTLERGNDIPTVNMLAADGTQTTRRSNRISTAEHAASKPRMTSGDSENGPDPLSLRDETESVIDTSGDEEIAASQHDDQQTEKQDKTLAEQIEYDAQMQKLHAEFLELVKLGYTRDQWFKLDKNVKSLVLDTQGLFWRGHQLVIPEYSDLRRSCLKLCHDAPWAGHFGMDRTLQLVQQIYWWPRLLEDVKAYVATCPPCQRNKALATKPYGLLQPLQIPERRWSSTSVDFITQLPITTSGHDAITVHVDRLSKAVKIRASKCTDSAADYARDFVKDIFSQHGLPMEIISDRDTKFTSKFWEQVTEALGVRRCLSTSFHVHPRSDGQTERTNRVVEEVLRAYISPDQSDWDEHLPLIEFAINNSVNKSIGTTPFLMMYGQTPLTPASLPIAKIQSKAFPFIANWNKRVAQAKTFMAIAQQKQAKYFNEKVHEKQFKVGDKVLLSTKNLQFKGSKLERTKKFAPKYVGPYTIKEKVGMVAYKLELPDCMKVHPVFHVSLLREFRSDSRYAPPPPEIEFVDGERVYKMEAIVDDRLGGPRKLQQYLVKWQGYDELTYEYGKPLREDSDYAGVLIERYLKTKAARLKEKPSSKKRKKNKS